VLASRYGRLEFKPEMIASLIFQSDDTPVHQILLTDGSQLSGLIDLNPLRLELTASPSASAVTFPQSAVSRLDLAPAHEDEKQPPTITLSGGDRLIGAIAGVLTLDTTFDSLKIDGSHIRAIAQTPDSPVEVQVTTSDGATISGRINGESLNISLACGASVSVPVALLERFSQPTTAPSAAH
jgi:hypothetical protein